MKTKPETRLYRIGDYARFMGVSTDLLKHYEKLNLIQSETAGNGYRYYSFQQSAVLLECMRLQNYGLSLREMHKALHDSSFEEVKTLLDSKIDDMEKRLQFQQRVVDEHRRISQWMDMMKDQETCITFQENEPFYFLPQSHQRDFIQDPRIGELLPAWIDAMPMVKSCRSIPDVTSSSPTSWGLAVAQSDLDALRLPVNDVVQRIEGGRFVYAHFRHEMTELRQQQIPPQDVVEKLHAYALKPGCNILMFSMMRMGDNQCRTNCGWFCAPLADSSD